MKRASFWINAGWMQASWWACVLGAAHGLLWPGLMVVSVFALWQLHPARRDVEDLVTVLQFVVVGLVLDSLWPAAGVLAYSLPGPVPGLAPAWMILLWIALGLTVHHSLAMFKAHWQSLVLVLIVGSPLSYATAAGLGAVQWIAPGWVVMLCVGPVWALIVGLLFRQAGRGSQAPTRIAEDLQG